MYVIESEIPDLSKPRTLPKVNQFEIDESVFFQCINETFEKYTGFPIEDLWYHKEKDNHCRNCKVDGCDGSKCHLTSGRITYNFSDATYFALFGLTKKVIAIIRYRDGHIFHLSTIPEFYIPNNILYYLDAVDITTNSHNRELAKSMIRQVVKGPALFASISEDGLFISADFNSSDDRVITVKNARLKMDDPRSYFEIHFLAIGDS